MGLGLESRAGFGVRVGVGSRVGVRVRVGVGVGVGGQNEFQSRISYYSYTTTDAATAICYMLLDAASCF